MVWQPHPTSPGKAAFSKCTSHHFTDSPMLTSHRSHELENVSLKRSKPSNQPHNNQTEQSLHWGVTEARSSSRELCQGTLLSSGGSCQTPISTEGMASCMMQTRVWEVEDEKNLNQRSEWQKLERWGQAQFSEESILPGELKQSQTSCNKLLSKKKSVYSGAPADFLKTNQAAGSSTSNASKYFICKRCSEASTHSLLKDILKVGQKASLSLRRNQVPNK